MRRRRSSEEVRARILEVADELFYTGGFASTGVDAIVSAVPVSKSTFYAHFKTKEQLAVAYLEQRHDDWFAALDACVHRHRTPTSRALAPFKFLQEWLPSVDYRGCAFLNLMGEHPLPPALAEQVTRHKSQLREHFRASVSELAPGATRARALGDQLLLLFEGAIVQCQVHRASWPAQAAHRAAKQALSAP